MQTLIISDDQNTVIYEGKKYIARKDTKKISWCGNCDLRGRGICHKIPCSNMAGRLKRKDGKEVHFKQINKKIMKTGEKMRIKGTSENVRVVKINGDNVTVRLKNGTVKAVNICSLRMPVKNHCNG